MGGGQVEQATTAAAISIAIVGSGPSGCYCAHFLRKALPQSEIVVIDAEPVPYGLIRYGVAADHQGTKRVTAQFDRLFERDGVHFLGNVHVGRDLEPELLLEAFDVVILATGSDQDRALRIPVDENARVVPAGTVLRALNGHPGAALPELGPHGLGGTIAVVGNGNVALDVVRLLAKADEQMDGSDVDDDVLRAVRPRPVQNLLVIGRSSAAEAKFDPVCLKEVLHLPQVRVTAELLDNDEGPSVALLREANEQERTTEAVTTVSFVFQATPVAVSWQDDLTLLQVSSGANRSSGRTFGVDTIVTAIGFEDPRESPRLLPEGPRVRTVGWLHRGPRGTIPENRRDAKDVCDAIVEDLQTVLSSATPRPGMALVRERLGPHPVVDFAGWQRIDTFERLQARPGRCRSKVTDREHIVRLSRDIQPAIAP